MTDNEKGFLLFYDWHDILTEMSARNFKLVLTAMVEYQHCGKQPPEFPENIRPVATLMFAQLKRRMKNAENGRRGGQATAKSIREKDERENIALSDDEGDLSPLLHAYIQD